MGREGKPVEVEVPCCVMGTSHALWGSPRMSWAGAAQAHVWATPRPGGALGVGAGLGCGTGLALRSSECLCEGWLAGRCAIWALVSPRPQ